jgi:hypothetical protein
MPLDVEVAVVYLSAAKILPPMKKILSLILIAFVFSCDRNEEEGQIYAFSGTVKVPQFNGNDPVSLPNAKLIINFYTGDTQPFLKLVESTDLTADADGKFALQKKLPENLYTYYSIQVNEPYYHDCTGVTSSLDIVQYQGFSEELSYANNLLACHTGNVRIVANKTNDGSDTSLTLSNKATSGSVTLIDAEEVLTSDAERTYYFFDRVSQVVFTFQKRTGETLTSEEEVVVNPTAGTTTEINVDF